MKYEQNVRLMRPGRRSLLCRGRLRALAILTVGALAVVGCSSGEGGALVSEPPPPIAQVPSVPGTGQSAPPVVPLVPQQGGETEVATAEPDLPPPIEQSDRYTTTTVTTRPPEFENPEITRLPEGQAPTELPQIQAIPAPAWQPQQILISKPDLRQIIPVYDTPGGNEINFKDGPLWSYTYRENQMVVRVLQGNPGDEWVLAELPMRPWDNFTRPNGVQGWIRTAEFDWRTVNHHIQIDLSDDDIYPAGSSDQLKQSYARVDFWNGDEWILGTYAIVGKPQTYTPVMDSFLVEKFEGDNPVLGRFVMMLSGFSTTHDLFDGGLPRIALHGTHIPERVGEELSNGCIRIPNQHIERINAEAPLGTRVNIVA